MHWCPTSQYILYAVLHTHTAGACPTEDPQHRNLATPLHHLPLSHQLQQPQRDVSVHLLVDAAGPIIFGGQAFVLAVLEVGIPQPWGGWMGAKGGQGRTGQGRDEIEVYVGVDSIYIWGEGKG